MESRRVFSWLTWIYVRWYLRFSFMTSRLVKKMITPQVVPPVAPQPLSPSPAVLYLDRKNLKAAPIKLSLWWVPGVSKQSDVRNVFLTELPMFSQSPCFFSTTCDHFAELPASMVWMINKYVVVSDICYFHPYLGKWSNLTVHIFFRWVGSTTRTSQQMLRLLQAPQPQPPGLGDSSGDRHPIRYSLCHRLYTPEN